jgi:translation initiation factor 4E
MKDRIAEEKESQWRKVNENDWEDKQHPVINFDTVEDFWACFNSVKAPSKLSKGSQYSLFRTGIKPMWEDPVNEKGGRIKIQLPKFKLQSSSHRDPQIDVIWLDMLIMAVGESLEGSLSEFVNGIVVSIRSRTKIEIWLNTCDKQSVILKIGRAMERVVRELDHINLKKMEFENFASKFKWEL